MASTEGGALSIVGSNAGTSKTMSIALSRTLEGLGRVSLPKTSLKLHFLAAKDSTGGELPFKAAEARLVDVFCLEWEAVVAFTGSVETLVTMVEAKEKKC